MRSYSKLHYRIDRTGRARDDGRTIMDAVQITDDFSTVL